MAVILSQPISLKAGPTTSPGIQLADDVTVVRATLTHWNGQNTTTCFVQISFDNGVTWRDWGGIGPSTAPSGTFKNRLDLFVQIEGVWKVCQCGELYVPNALGNGSTTNHSTYRDWTSDQIAALPNGWLHELDSGAFHNPDLTPMTGLPLRQVRVVCNASGNINSQLVVDAS